MGKIIVVTHKNYNMPDNSLYYPIAVGKYGESNLNTFNSDNSGINIAYKNIAYCELTAIYWAWKNLEEDFMGVAHYRRYLTNKKNVKNYNELINETDINNYLSKYDMLLTKKKFYFSSIANHYINSKKAYREIHQKDIEHLIMAVKELSPDYMDSLNKVLNSHSAHMLNMFITNKEIFNKYCEWLFLIIDRTVDYSKERTDQRRYAGALSEFLLDVFIDHHKLKYKELYLFETEKQNILKKIINKIERKLRNE